MEFYILNDKSIFLQGEWWSEIRDVKNETFKDEVEWRDF